MISPLNSLKQTETPQDLNKSALVLLDRKLFYCFFFNKYNII